MTKSRGIGRGQNNPYIGTLWKLANAQRDCTPHLQNETPEEYRKRCGQRYYESHPDRVIISKRCHTIQMKMAVLSHYSLAEEPECARCGINDIDVLCIDHVNGVDPIHKKTPLRSGGGLYEWLIKSGYPKGFQVLCANCNLKKRLEDQREKDARIISIGNSTN